MYNNNYRKYGPSAYEEEFDVLQGLNSYVSKVYGWMFAGLLITAIVAYLVSTSEIIVVSIISNPLLYFGLFIVELILVGALSSRVEKLSYGTAIALFIGYAVVNGLTLSIIFLVYTGETLVSAFLVTSLSFGAMSLYGYLTKTDLFKFRNILFMGLIGIIITSVINVFLSNSTLDWITSIVGLFVFLGLTAYDMQKLKAYYVNTGGDLELRQKVAITGALSLYLDFINLFLIILRFSSRRRS